MSEKPVRNGSKTHYIMVPKHYVMQFEEIINFKLLVMFQNITLGFQNTIT